MVKKIFYWSPYLGRVATIRAVINSMIGLSNLRKNKCNISIINCYGEWDNQTINFRKNNINNVVELFSLADINVDIRAMLKARPCKER